MIPVGFLDKVCGGSGGSRQLPRPKGRGLQLYSPNPYWIIARYVSLHSGLSPMNPEAVGPIDTPGKGDSGEWRPHLLTRH